MVGSEHVFGKLVEGCCHEVICRAISEFAKWKYEHSPVKTFDVLAEIRTRKFPNTSRRHFARFNKVRNWDIQNDLITGCRKKGQKCKKIFFPHHTKWTTYNDHSISQNPTETFFLFLCSLCKYIQRTKKNSWTGYFLVAHNNLLLLLLLLLLQLLLLLLLLLPPPPPPRPTITIDPFSTTAHTVSQATNTGQSNDKIKICIPV